MGRGLRKASCWVALLAALLLTGSGSARADAFGLEMALLTTHLQGQRDVDANRYPRRLDDRGTNVLTPGIESYLEYNLEQPLWGARQVRYVIGLVSDSAAQQLGYVAALARWELLEAGRLGVSLQIGPGFMWRESWRKFPEYHRDNAFQQSKNFIPGYEWVVLPLADLDVTYAVAPTWQIVWSIFPGVPYVITQSIGFRHTY